MPKKKASSESPAKSKRDYTVVGGLDKRLKPISLGKRSPKKVDRFEEKEEHPLSMIWSFAKEKEKN